MAPIRFPINDWDDNGSTDDLFDIVMDMQVYENFKAKDGKTGILDSLLNAVGNLDYDSDDCNYDDENTSIEVETEQNEDDVAKSAEIYKIVWTALSSVFKEYLGLDFKGETNPEKIKEMLNYYKYGWREKCESGSDYFLSPYKYKTESEYLAVLDYAKKIKERYEAKIANLTKNYYIDENCEDNKVYTYCGVVYEGNSMVFHYRADDQLLIKPGDIVIVPCGQNNMKKEATVVSIGKYLSNAVPYPIEETKEIIRKK